VSIDPVDRLNGHAPQPASSSFSAPAESLDFVRFCYRRRRVAWPALYDEMCAVASRGAFRGLGYAELSEHGISFCLPDLHQLAALTEQVILEERTSPEPLRTEPVRAGTPRAEPAATLAEAGGAVRLAAAPATS
jgi:hypothetical protein